jgi:hypothetical protein
VKRIDELGALAVTINRRTLTKNTLEWKLCYGTETSVLTRAIRFSIPDEGILHGTVMIDIDSITVKPLANCIEG